MNRSTLTMLAALVLVIQAFGPAVSEAADQPKPPMVGASSAPAPSPEMAKLSADAAPKLKITLVQATTRKKTVGDETYNILKNPTKESTKVTYTYQGEETTLKGWEAVQFLWNAGLFEGKLTRDGGFIGLVATDELAKIGPGATEAILDGSETTTVTYRGSSDTSDTDSEGTDTSGSTHTSAGTGQGGAGAGGGSGGTAAGDAGDSEESRRGATEGGQAAAFTCDVELSAGTLLGAAGETDAYAECKRKVNAKRNACIRDARGDHTREDICRTKCDEVMASKCAPLGPGIHIQNSSPKKDGPQS